MSFFGKKTTKAQAVSKSVVMTTGGKVDDIVSALIENANDSNKDVKSKIIESLKDIGRKQPELVLRYAAAPAHAVLPVPSPPQSFVA